MSCPCVLEKQPRLPEEWEDYSALWGDVALIKPAQCKSLLTKPQAFRWQAADGLHPEAILRGDLSCLNRGSL